MRRYFLCSVLAVVVVLPALGRGHIVALAAGEQPAEDDPNKVRTVPLVLQPAAEPRMALMYQLLPPLLDRKPGNAAVMYNKLALLMSMESSSEKGKYDFSQRDWLERPLSELPRKEVAEVLAHFRAVLDDLDLAARRETCDWELPLRERNIVSLLLPELQQMRSLARLLALQARLQIAEGQFDQALRTIQTGYALARHVAEGRTLIHGLVGIAICQMMSQRVQELIQQPGAPNLYWALTSLPRPLIDMRPAAETEMNMLYLWFPALRKVDEDTHSVAYWQHFADKMVDSVSAAWGAEQPKVGWRTVLTVLAIKGYPAAKRYLIEQGRSSEEVEAMPVAQVVAIHTVQTYNELRDQMFKWFYVPYAEAREGMQKADRALATEGRKREILPLASMLLPAVTAVNVASARNDRSIAVLRTIEALRMYGAAHDGHLPEKLADISEVPVPVDPITGQAFLYHQQGDTAVLESPAPPGKTPRDYGLRYEIKFRR